MSRRLLIYGIGLLGLLSTSAVAGTYALLDGTNTVVNIVQWDGHTNYPVPSGYILVPYAPPAGVGSTWNGSVFSAAPPGAAGAITSQYDIAAIESALIARGNLATTTGLSAAAASNLTAMQAVVPVLAPVQSVNALTGAVSVPTFQRKIASVPLTGGTGTWTFDSAFSSTPICLGQVVSTSSTYVFAAPQLTAVSTTSLTVTLQAALKVLSISLGALTVWGAPPAGTTLNMICLAPV